MLFGFHSAEATAFASDSPAYASSSLPTLSYPVVDFVDTLPPDGTLVHTSALEPALLKDVARTFELLGVESFRASAVDVSSMALDSQWSVNQFGEVSTVDSDISLDSSFPGASAALSQLAHADSDKTMTQKLGPQRWRFAWRKDERHALVAEVHFHERRDSIIDIDIALVRLVCCMGVQESQSGNGNGTLATPARAWPETERRCSSPVSSVNALTPGVLEVDAPTPNTPHHPRLALALLLASVLSTGWMAAIAIPQTYESAASRQAELAKLRSMGQDTMVQDLSMAMASGDYGQVQTALSSFASLGYFSGAVVTNPRQRIVSLAGRAERLRIGDALPADVARIAQTLDLKLGSQPHGQLLIMPAPPPAASGLPSAALGIMAWAAFVASAAATTLLAWRMFGRRPLRAVWGGQGAALPEKSF